MVPVGAALEQHAGLLVDGIGRLLGLARGEQVARIADLHDAVAHAQHGVVLRARDDRLARVAIAEVGPPGHIGHALGARLRRLPLGLGRALGRVGRQDRIAIREVARLQDGAVQEVALRVARLHHLGRAIGVLLHGVVVRRAARQAVDAGLREAGAPVVVLDLDAVINARLAELVAHCGVDGFFFGHGLFLVVEGIQRVGSSIEPMRCTALSMVSWSGRERSSAAEAKAVRSA
ncbi:hypothetical protein D3C85_1149950 [compost metagenome]